MIKGLESQAYKERITEMMLVGQKEEKAAGDLIAVLVCITGLIKRLGTRCCSPAKTERDGMGGSTWTVTSDKSLESAKIFFKKSYGVAKPLFTQPIFIQFFLCLRYCIQCWGFTDR